MYLTIYQLVLCPPASFALFGFSVGLCLRLDTFSSSFLQSVVISSHDDAALIADVLHATRIVVALRSGKFVYVEAFACHSQSGSLRLVVYLARLEEFNPFVEVVNGEFVEIVNTKEVVFRENVADLTLCLLAFCNVIFSRGLMAR